MEQEMNNTDAASGYQVGTIFWPDGWEPQGPLDVPHCILSAKTSLSAPILPYFEAEGVVHALNRQCIDSPGTTWYVVVAGQKDPVSQREPPNSDAEHSTIAVDESRIVRPQRGTSGDCSCCPAHNLPCAKGE